MSVRKWFLAAVLAVVAACAVNPATGRRELTLFQPGENEEIQMGREADGEITASLGLVDDPELQAYVSEIGQRMAAASERPELPWSFKVVDDPVVNAFALPGGFIYITRGILAYFESEAELAGVVGHEIGHVTAKHSVNQISRQRMQQLGLGVGMVFSETVRQYGDLASAGLQLMNLRYSRGDESEADELGLRYITRVGYDPEAMVGVFQMLAQVSGGAEGRIPEWQLTHPYPENREANIRSQMAAQGITGGGTVRHDELLDHIDGIVFGDDPRQGYFKDTRFLHPELAFELTFPAGWTTVNQRTVVGGIAPDQSGVVTLQVVTDAGAPRSELDDFLGQEDVTGGPIREDGSGAVERVRANFRVTTESGPVAGEVAFVRYAGTVYQLTGYAAQADFGRHSASIAAAISSFSQLTDSAVLTVQPWRIDVVTLPSAMSLRSWYQRSPGPVDVEELGRLNRRDPGEVLSAGTRIKTVVGQPLP